MIAASLATLDQSVRGAGRRLSVSAPAILAAPAALLLGLAMTRLALGFGSKAPTFLVLELLVPAIALLVVLQPWLSAAVVIATFPVALVTLAPSLQVVDATVLFMAILVALRRVGVGAAPLRWPAPLTWMLLLVIWALVATPSAIDHALAVKVDIHVVAGLFVVYVVLASCAEMRHIRGVVGSLVIVGTAIVLMNSSQFSGAQAQGGGAGNVTGRAQGIFDHPNQFGSFCAIAALAAIGLAGGSPSRRVRMASSASAVGLMVGLAFSLSRGAWIGFSLGLLYLLVSERRLRRILLPLAILLAIAAGLLAPYTSSKPEVQVIQLRLQAIATQSPYDTRTQVWKEALRQIRADPWTGSGPGNFLEASARDSEASTLGLGHAHNIWLTWAAESGIPAALFIVGLVLALTVYGRTTLRRARAGSSRDSTLIAGIVAALISVVGQGMFDYTVGNPLIFYTLWILIGLLLVAHRESAAAGSRLRTLRG